MLGFEYLPEILKIVVGEENETYLASPDPCDKMTYRSRIRADLKTLAYDGQINPKDNSTRKRQ